MNNRAFILGEGFIGIGLKESFDFVLSTKRGNPFKDAEGIIKKYNPGISINCISHAGKNNPDGCEDDNDLR